MTDKEIDKTLVEFLVERRADNKFEAVRLIDGFADTLGKFETYEDAFDCAQEKFVDMYADGAGGVAMFPPEWDEELGEELDTDDFEEIETPTFTPGLYVANVAAVADDNGELWFIDPFSATMKRVVVSEEVE